MDQSGTDRPGPDFAAGIPIGDLPREGTLAGRVGDEAVLLSRFGNELFAVGGTCTHYGAALAQGVRTRETVRCPLHHACFSLRTGEALRAPAFAPLDRWRVEVKGSIVFIREKLEAEAAVPRPASTPGEAGSVVIIGGGAAGFACAEMLRRLGHAGPVTLLSQDVDAPYDRPNLSKDYLAGSAPNAWMPLREPGWYSEQAIDLRLETQVATVDAGRRIVTAVSGETFFYDQLLIATGSEPIRPGVEGFDHANVHVLRSFADARAVAGRAEAGARAVIVGSGFIGLEAAAALSSRGVAVEIISRDELPMQQAFGPEVGHFLRSLHEARGVRFHLGRTAAGFDGMTLSLDNGDTMEADFILLGLGVRPRTALAEAAGIEVADGILVNGRLETSVPGIYAAGDVASYPDDRSGRRLRIEHWVTAQRQGQAAAINMLGGAQPFAAVPFFWTDQYGTVLRYVGQAADATDVRIAGSIEDGDFSVRYGAGGALRALLSVRRDRENLEAEMALEGETDFAAVQPS